MNHCDKPVCILWFEWLQRRAHGYAHGCVSALESGDIEGAQWFEERATREDWRAEAVLSGVVVSSKNGCCDASGGVTLSSFLAEQLVSTPPVQVWVSSGGGK